MRDVLLIMHAREIPECLEAHKSLDIPKAWFRGFTEQQLQQVLNEFIKTTDADNFIINSDDTLPTQLALDILRDGLREKEVLTGWCNLAPGSALTNLGKRPLRGSWPSSASYSFPTFDWVMSQDAIFRTYFVGWSLTGLRKRLWMEHPFKAWRQVRGHDIRWLYSDYMMSVSLTNWSIPMWCAKDAWEKHLASRDNFIVGKVSPEIIKEGF